MDVVAQPFDTVRKLFRIWLRNAICVAMACQRDALLYDHGPISSRGHPRRVEIVRLLSKRGVWHSQTTVQKSSVFHALQVSFSQGAAVDAILTVVVAPEPVPICKPHAVGPAERHATNNASQLMSKRRDRLTQAAALVAGACVCWDRTQQSCNPCGGRRARMTYGGVRARPLSRATDGARAPAASTRERTPRILAGVV